MLGLVSTLVFVSTFFSVQGFRCSSHESGQVSDADFWFLLQSSLMQIALSSPVIMSVLAAKGNLNQARWWTLVFMVSSIACSLVAPFLYVYIPTEYASVTAFAGSAAQAFIVLEAIFPISTTKIKNS
jgi:hypothetical protein